ncbi:MAG: polysaccharide biosynthesis C-terminal domain-containing protein, partial [Chloroflexi bacterium]|nr:polysaccharide biosynthesis C-terminal domain-containing protein [Chloroflexota bacterium]
GVREVGIYSFAVQFLEPVWIIATSAVTGYLVGYGPLSSSAGLRALFRAAGTVAIITCGGLIALLLAMPSVVQVVGRGFVESLLPALLVSPGILFLSVSKVLAAHQLAAGRLWLSSSVASASLLVTTVADVVLMPHFGAIGASAASSVGYGISLALWIYTTRTYAARDRLPVEAGGRP